MSKNKTFSYWITRLAFLVACTSLVTPLTARGDNGTNDTVRPPAPVERRDNVWGTMDENIRMGNDPQTGDIIIRVTPKPQPKPQYGLPPITVEPQVTIAPRNGQSD